MSKDVILNRIRSALAHAPDAPEVPRTYRQQSQQSRDAILHEFIDIVTDYKATLIQCSPADVSTAIAKQLNTRALSSLLIPEGLPDSYTQALTGMTLVKDNNLSALELNGVDGVITACAVAIAQTGTLVLDGGAGQGRRALTLVPDYHLCVVRAGQVVGLVPEAVEALEPAMQARRPLTFISGPSATSDIELSRVEGVHGPRTLDIVLIKESVNA